MFQRLQEQVVVLYRYQPPDDPDSDLFPANAKLTAEPGPLLILACAEPVQVKSKGHYPEFFFGGYPEIMHQLPLLLLRNGHNGIRPAAQEALGLYKDLGFGGIEIRMEHVAVKSVHNYRHACCGCSQPPYGP